jgi:hypothetical protein
MKIIITSFLLAGIVCLSACSDNEAASKATDKKAAATDSAKERTVKDMDTAAEIINAGQVPHP